jgi:hypothetical protein
MAPQAFLLLILVVVLGLPRIAAAESPPPIIKAGPGFAVERVYEVPRDTQGSWISLGADERGVLYASDQTGPLYRIELSAADKHPHVARIDLPIGGVHGMTWLAGKLYAVVGERDVCQPGLYRLEGQ